MGQTQEQGQIREHHLYFYTGSAKLRCPVKQAVSISEGVLVLLTLTSGECCLSVSQPKRPESGTEVSFLSQPCHGAQPSPLCGLYVSPVGAR